MAGDGGISCLVIGMRVDEEKFGGGYKKRLVAQSGWSFSCIEGC